MPKARLVALASVLLAVFSLLYGPATRYLRASQLLLALSAAHGAGSAATPPAELVVREVTVPGGAGPIRARLYRLAGSGPAPGLVVAHGVHYQGIDERRLVPFAKELARAGRVVLTPELADLADYRITRRGADVIADAARWLGEQPEVSEPAVGVLGFSFAGGLALVAASEPGLEGRLAYVTSVGGHHDLERVLRFLVSDEIDTPQGPKQTKAHDYGLAVLVYESLERFVEPPDVEPVRDAFRHHLHGDRELSLAAGSLRTTASGERLVDLLRTDRLEELRPELERIIAERAPQLARLSPKGRLGRIGAPVYLLHGSEDRVIPPSELEWAERELDGATHLSLVSPLLEHVEVNKSAALGHQLALVDFMSRML